MRTKTIKIGVMSYENFKKYGIVDLVENKRTKVPVAIATSFNLEYGKKYPSSLFDDNAFQATTTGATT
jgi:hypothetical protein